jgi:L-ascorbate metabolism protein UlaG (beta-lactamase superfamily)
VPVGGTYTLDGKRAKEVVEQIEPKVVIPMHYALPDLNIKIDGVDSFLKEMGIKESHPQSNLVLDNFNMSSEKTTVVVLDPQS